jgi:hypothetical protein
VSNNKPSRFGLGQQQAIKGIAVQRRQLGQRQDMGGLDRQTHKAPIQQRAPQHRRLHLNPPAPQGRLDHQLPEGGNAEAQAVARILQQFP